MSDRTMCAKCGEPVTAWPYAVVPQTDGSLATFHEECTPWAHELEGQQVGGLELLSDQERQTVVEVVQALVSHDEPRLRRFGAISDDMPDPYEPTRGWRLWAKVDLVLPSGEPADWEADVFRTAERGWTVDVRMWTVQEKGPSDLVLHLDVAGTRVLYRGMWT
jgi:hypothetical protein